MCERGLRRPHDLNRKSAERLPRLDSETGFSSITIIQDGQGRKEVEAMGNWHTCGGSGRWTVAPENFTVQLRRLNSLSPDQENIW